MGTHHWPFDLCALLGVACPGGGTRSPRAGGSCCRCEGRLGLGTLPLPAACPWGRTPCTKARGAPPGDALLPPPQGAALARKSLRCGVGAGPSYPQAPCPRDTDNRSQLPAGRTGSRQRESTEPQMRRHGVFHCDVWRRTTPTKRKRCVLCYKNCGLRQVWVRRSFKCLAPTNGMNRSLGRPVHKSGFPEENVYVRIKAPFRVCR